MANPITNQRWAVSAFGTATAASLTAGDAVYCTSPLRHSAGLTVVSGTPAGQWERAQELFAPARGGVFASARLRVTDLQLGLGFLPVGQRPRFARVAPEIPFSPTCRPLGHTLRAEGAPRPGRGVWLRDDHGVHAPFTSGKARALGW
ncbi:hypothetical protein [Segniliparus rotundus]|uniref:hypothetical protein n=1 Tax=Segniliparus rotundus TaxID=286802 RepID=UPI0011D09E09|nr:hypothetical protein [Segniliparus rotundus]